MSREPTSLPPRIGHGAAAPNDPSPGVLYVDTSVGFGGATMSLSLLWQGLPDVRKHLLTAQNSDIVARWYGAARIHPFRRIVNYPLHERARRLGRVPALMCIALDAAVERLNTVRVKRLTRRHRLGLLHCNNGPLPREALFGALAVGLPLIAHVRGFVEPGKPETPLRRRAVSRYIAVSRAVADGIIASGAAPERVMTIYNPVDLGRFDAVAGERLRLRRQMRLADGDFAVGIFGRVVGWKGQLEFVQAVLRALPEQPHLKGIIVGDGSGGSDAYLRSVRECVETSGHGDRFVFVGYQPDVEGYYHAVDAVVHASVEPEPFGRVVPEGMAAGKPVIAAGEGGPVEVVTEGVDGLLAAPRDVDGLATALSTLAGDPELGRRMGRHGREKVEHSFTVERIAGQVRSVYDELLTGFRA